MFQSFIKIETQLNREEHLVMFDTKYISEIH